MELNPYSGFHLPKDGDFEQKWYTYPGSVLGDPTKPSSGLVSDSTSLGLPDELEE